MKDNVVLLNFVRAEILDNEPLLKNYLIIKLEIISVIFSNVLFKKYFQVICLAHLGTSTKEAEENFAIMISDHHNNS